MKKSTKLYFDYAATTPVDPVVFRAMKPYFTEKFGNPGSLHGFGQAGIAAVDAARETIAKTIGAEFREIIFTSSATEANNLALRGVAKSVIKENAPRNSKLETRNFQIIISCIEHESVLETARDLEKEGIDVVYLPVDRNGVVDLKKLKESLNEDTILVSIMYANNEIGTIQPIAEIAKMLRDFRATRDKDQVVRKENSAHSLPAALCSMSPYPLLHVDAAQAFQFFDCNVNSLGIDLMTLSAHKIYGPKGAGVLYVGSRVSGFEFGKNNPRNSKLETRNAILTGGGQEFGFRSGTENVPAIVGFAEAIARLSFQRSQERWNEELFMLRERLWKGIKKIYLKAQLNSPCHISSVTCLPNLLNVYFPNHDAQDLLTRFDLNGLAVSSGSACRSRAMESSYVIQALGYSADRAKSSIRFSLGRPTTKQDVDGALAVIRRSLR